MWNQTDRKHCGGCGKIKAEAPDLSMPMDVDLDLSATSSITMESEVSLLEPEAPPYKLQCGQNSVLMAISEKESKISDQPRKGSSNKKKKRKKKTKRLSGAEMESSAPQLRHLSENEQKDIERLSKVDTETEQPTVGSENRSYSGSDDLINDQNSICNITNLQVAADDEHPPNSTNIEEVPASCGPVGNLVNLDIVAFQSDITDKDKDGVVQSVTESDPLHPSKSNKPASAVNEGSLITEKLSSRKDGTQSGRGITPDESESTFTSADNKPLHTPDSDSSSSVEENNDQYDMKKEKDILLTQKSRKKKSNNLSATIQSTEISSALQPKPSYSGNEYDIKEGNEVGIEARSYFTSIDLTSDLNSARDIADLQAAVGDKHSPSSTCTVKTLDSHNLNRGQVNTGLAVSKNAIVTAKNMDGAVQSVAESDLYSKNNNKSAYVIDDGLSTTEKLSSGKDIELERGDNLGESVAAAARTDSELLDSADSNLNSSVKEKTTEQHGMTKEEDVPCTKVKCYDKENEAQKNEKEMLEHDSEGGKEKLNQGLLVPTKRRNSSELSAKRMDNKNDATSTESEGLSRNQKKKKRKHLNDTTAISRSMPLSQVDTVVIYFHALLSKDFKFNPEFDMVTVRGLDDDWKMPKVEMSVTKNLKEHGYLIEGHLFAHKNIIGKHLPYKYAVCKMHSDKTEYETIYKWDTPDGCITNRCLCIKPDLVFEGEWHQYDDIICAAPEGGFKARVKNIFKWSKNTDVTKGKLIAGEILVESMFNILSTWNEKNLKSFLNQLRQFYEVYKNPMVFENRPVNWSSLLIGEKEVKNLLFKVLKERAQCPENQASKSETSSVQNRLRTGVLLLYLAGTYDLEVQKSDLHTLCDLLCVQQNSVNTLTKEFKSLKESFHFGEKIETLLKRMMLRCINQGIIKWVQTIPVLHLFGVSTHQATPEFLDTEDSWTGLNGLPFVNFRNEVQNKFKRDLLDLMDKNKHLATVDRLLLRSWFSLLPMEFLPDYLKMMTPDLFDVLQGIFHRLRNNSTISSINKNLENLLKHVKENVDSHQNSDLGDECIDLCMKTSLKIHEKICKSRKDKSDVEIIAVSIALISKLGELKKSSLKIAGEKSQKEETPVMENTQALLKTALTITRSWLKDVLSGDLFSEYDISINQSELQVWVTLVTLDFGCQKWTSMWNEGLLSDLEGRIKKRSHVGQIEIYCSKHEELSSLQPLIAKCLENCAFDAVHSICQDKSEGKLLDKLLHYDLTKFGKLLSTIIEKSWLKDQEGKFLEDHDSVVKHLLDWSAAQTIFKVQGTDSKLIDTLSYEARHLMAIADSVFMDMMNRLLDGSIKIKHLDLILKKKRSFMALHNTRTDGPFNGKTLRQLLTLRKEEFEAFNEESNWMDSLLKMCRKINEFVKVEIEELEKLVGTNVESKALSELVTIKQVKDLEFFPTQVTYFILTEKLKEMAKSIHTFKDSYVLQMCWEKEAKALCEEDTSSDEETSELTSLVSLEGVHAMIWEPCLDKYKGIFKKLKEGSLMLEEVNIIFKDFVNRYEDLRSDFEIMCRIDMSAKGNWIEKRIQQIREYHQLHLAVESAQVIMKAQNVLKLTGDFNVLQTLIRVTDESYKDQRLDCINEQLIQAKNRLVEITPSRRNCLEELTLRQQFVHWIKEALEGTNELKVFVDLASISAGENDLDVDRVACFHDAVLGYSSLLFELKPNAGFADFMFCLQKLWNALDNDPDLSKKLCDSARHLEWLKTVKESHGSVEMSSLSLASAINSNGVYIISSQEKKKLSLGSAITLILSEVHDDSEELRSYNLEELKELQNKLMLMSGKGDHGREEVDRFVEVFASVQRLATSFISLYLAGNMLFRNWTAEVHCSRKNEACMIINFNLDNVSEIKADGNVTEQLPILCKKMEAYLEKWKKYMNQQRSQYYYLNFYTAEQIVYLCTKLFDQNCTSLHALMMLSFIKPDCTAEDVRIALKKLPAESGNTRIQLLAGDNSDNETLMKTKAGIQDIAEERDMEEKLDLLWEHYMKNMSYFLSNSLDISTLGKLLHIVADTKQTVTRVLPPGFQESRPNLVVCPHSELLTSALSIYMYSSDQPLPTYDEVLLCTAETTYEQVELFMRRCLTGCEYSKIYALLYAEELTYDISVRCEELFKSLELESHSHYKMLILCSCEREHCYIPSAFSQYKVHVVPHEPLEKIQIYLNDHYRIAVNVSSAASVFKDRMFVRIISSMRAGVGKSLYVKRLHETLKKQTGKDGLLKTIRLIEPWVDENKILRTVLSFIKSSNGKKPMIFHFDITSSVQRGLYEFIFKLLILRYLMGTDGKMWKCKPCHMYVVEMLDGSGFLSRKHPRHRTQMPKHGFLDIFPKVYCRPPKEVLELEVRKAENLSWNGIDPLVDDEEFQSEAFQRPYQYLRRFKNQENLDTFRYQEDTVEGNHIECLQLFLIYCGVMDPSWSELRNFTCFLNLQLEDCETSVFCDFNFIKDTLQGFKTFVVNFMILMARDFATPSLSISDQSPGREVVTLEGVKEEDLAPFLVRKKWESEPHPYIFFNDDHTSMTFIGFHLRENGQGGIDAINPSNGKIIKPNIMTRELYTGLLLQRVPFNTDFDKLSRSEKVERLCTVLGIQWPMDPDETYELTTDNILKILAIHMRFRCGIPVIIMGETGCGKTRLIKFLCELRKVGANTENMKLVKVHGGTTADMIYSKVKDAEAIALENKTNFNFDTILFFDEANTTDAVNSIKEILCDQMIEGAPLTPNTGLQIIAACNPYRKHTNEMIERLESAGLGYRVRADETEDKLGSIPLRQLVYRVQALPPSMIPLVWDFGQLNDVTEKMYIQQIVQRLTQSISVPSTYIKCIVDVLSASQNFMRHQQDECGFVSLRDVERCMKVFVWFYTRRQMLLNKLKEFLQGQAVKNTLIDSKNDVIWCIVLALGVCYHACLEKKIAYRKSIARHLPAPYNNPAKFLEQLVLLQDLLLSGVPLRETIARNSALKENVFMMVICIELKIPLFLVGKPGSSKSLAKTIVADAMQGQAAHSELYKNLKQIHLVSFQCSPHSTPEGIINTFRQCARFQEGKNLDEYISVVVLDEIGLAEDSPKMPLKTLHPLLEDGCIDDDPLKHKKVGFIGISNWALDPAKMNRGIFVSRGDPDKKELIESAKGICSSDPVIQKKVIGLFVSFADAYLAICEKQSKKFFGLRDYYSLIKMVFSLSKATKLEPTPEQLVQIVLRNFSGNDDVNVMDVFKSVLKNASHNSINTLDLINLNLSADSHDNECRYLLILTKNYAALQILQQMFFSRKHQPEIIFGSSFPKDQEYTQICRNINRVKICMETGQMVVLLNLQNLYESLYDALNQYYVYLGGQKYVDLGLGTHRVKCRVHPDFRLIVIEEKEVVYKEFPIPLINRLEKHYLDINTVLDGNQRDIVKQLKLWVHTFTAARSRNTLIHGRHQEYCPSDVFVGFHSDTCASVVLQVTERLKQTDASWEEVLKEAQWALLNCATPDSVVCLTSSEFAPYQTDMIMQKYFAEQHHDSLVDFVRSHTKSKVQHWAVFTEVTTYSRLLTASDIEFLQREVGESVEAVFCFSLQQFDTEHSFLKKIRHCVDSCHGNKILLVQTDFENNSQSANLIASAKYSTINEINKSRSDDCTVYVYFITKLPRMEGESTYVGFHGDPWQSVHIDDLRKSKDMVADVTAFKGVTISQLFGKDPGEPEPMIVDHEEMIEEPVSESLFGNEKILDTTSLIRSCVQPAGSMLKDQHQSVSRSTKRVEILLSLLTEDIEFKALFLSMTKQRLHSLLLRRDEESVNATEWMVREASNLEALQEGGTFRHTLWKRVQKVVTPFLAQIISIIDRDYNLNLLIDDTPEILRKLWLDIFSDSNLLDIPYNRNILSLQSEIVIHNHMKMDVLAISNMLPFSWRIKDFLDELWIRVQYMEGQGEHKLNEIFNKTGFGKYILNLSEEWRQEFFLRYLHDFLMMTMTISSELEFEFLQGALISCVNELKIKYSIGDDLSIFWVHIAHQHFKNRLQNFSRIIAVQPSVLQLLQRLNNEIQKAESREMVIDVYAAAACVEMLESARTEMSPEAWLQKVNSLQMPIELICTEEFLQCQGIKSSVVHHVQAGWSQIFSLSLFVEHVVLGVEEIDDRLKNVVTKFAGYLGKSLHSNSDVRTRDPLQAVIKILRDCKESAGQAFSRFGLEPCPICIGQLTKPVLLPCDHIYCQDCLKQCLVPGQMLCPLCLTTVNDDFEVKVSEEIREAVEKNAIFRKRCDAFFIALVSMVCFKDNSPPTKEVITDLLSQLVTEKEVSIKILGSDRQYHTRTLSPFDDSVDRNPVVRSIVLKLLLKYSFDDIKDHLQQYLSAVQKSNILNQKDRTEFYALFLNCLEDSIYEKSQFCTVQEKVAYLVQERDFLQKYIKHKSSQTTIESLQLIARIRLCFDMASQLLCESHDTFANDLGYVDAKSKFLGQLKNMLHNYKNDWFRIYLVRKLCSLGGMEFVQQLLMDDQFAWLFPEQIFQQRDNPGQIDRYLVYGENYKLIRDAVGKAIHECKTKSIAEALKVCKCSLNEQGVHIILAIFREITILNASHDQYVQRNQAQCDTIQKYIENEMAFDSAKFKDLAVMLVKNCIPGLQINPGQSSLQQTMIEIIVHAAAVFFCGNNNILTPLQNFASQPANMMAAFLPTMPEDLTVEARGWSALQNLKWFQCPNGHPCVVGECGRPMEISRCVECNAEIGGRNHNAVDGFKDADMIDRTQIGHVLGDPRKRETVVAPDREMSTVSFLIIRLLTHTAMILGTIEDPQSITFIIKAEVPNPAAFLWCHFEKDMEQLIRSLGKSADEIAIVVHIILSHLIQLKGLSSPQYERLSSKQQRNNWEKLILQHVVTPTLKNLDRNLADINNQISQDKRISSNPIVKIVYSDPRTFLKLPEGQALHTSTIWSCRKRISIEHLRHIVEHKDGKDAVPILWRFLQKEAQLRLVKYLPELLTFQYNLVRRFQNATEVPTESVHEFLQNISPESLKHTFSSQISCFIYVWNQLRTFLATNGEIKIPEEYCSFDLDMKNCRLEVLLPRRQNLGLCSTALISYLIALHNKFVYIVEKYTSKSTMYSINPSDVADLHVIKYEIGRDLIPLISSNCQYTMEKGGETMFEYDLKRIEQQLTYRFLKGKPLINLTGIPTLIYRQEKNYENIFKDVKNKLPQELLPNSIINAISGELQSYSDVCEAFAAVEVTLGFLAMSGGDPNLQLVVYLKEVLQMEDQTAPHILEALRRCNLKHIQALWQLLSARKSECFLRLKQDPFSGIRNEYKEDLSAEERKRLHNFFMQASIDIFILELHEMLILKCKHVQPSEALNASWSLKDSLRILMDMKDVDHLPELEDLFPNEILLSKSVETWKAAVNFKRERLQVSR
ncbi:E3 ubiquitin-protein ligase rnf213-alpha-like isoform X2 [Stegostoma tigrinum]|uniref:E3 ubiquitin-protein ligase rnf213-alpha-like isoform X2 n=1 Tax=Stegostoma tigrinum TaxID=3053191 RepID=UPI0028706750|nr:E3 ubiquitin-protein ligase rnf213-alpha-like isoform X2 [Stegostoma tigrinum]XP_048410925.2 E3 ubiquitin-protein ligase rnf213-alpha-like isoform X2 [Stegostoma tigrinum]XP_048410926.2 E3 ubiquitin-protein ligase rnf213-alpha-like isoform X2 [Stegostoma tigrinum]XP_048410928.2 E3 ubiquitin-protein ligase rnf213-alpha-like isoform X2 [Stegostoma tigrinum]